jgi:hypothetical protein
MIHRIVIDTNIYISAIFWGGKPREVVDFVAGSDPGKLLFLHPIMLKIRDEMGLECAFGGQKAAFKN